MEAVEHDVAGGREGSGGHGGEMGPEAESQRYAGDGRRSCVKKRLLPARWQQLAPATAPGRFRGAVGVSAAA